MRTLRSCLLVGATVLALVEAWLQHREAVAIHQLSRQIVADAGAKTVREKTVALRDYVRAHVTHVGAPVGDDRPFLRATAVETLDSGLGFCGEVSRVFINLANAADIPAARLNLYGPAPHVVAYVDLGDGEHVVVDSLREPLVADLEPLDALMERNAFTDYSTINLRRLHLESLFSRTKLTLGPVTHWGENPHALKSAAWAALAGLLLALRAARVLARRLLHWRGWVHRSAIPSAAPAPPRARQTVPAYAAPEAPNAAAEADGVAESRS